MGMLALNLFWVCRSLFAYVFSAQAMLPLNPQAFDGLSPDVAFNAAVSFITNTDWQSYSGEGSLSYLSQMAGCAVQNFLSSATGMAVAVALFRALSRKQVQTIGNPYVDVVRSILYILLPLSFVFAIFLASQGVVQTFSPYRGIYKPIEDYQDQKFGIQVVKRRNFLPESRSSNPQSFIALGPVASQVAIKMLGSNGGGFFNANGAHPFENPTPLTNLLQIVAILLIPASFAYTFGVMVGDRRQGWMLLAAMTVDFIPLMLFWRHSGATGQSALRCACHRFVGGQYGRQGNALRRHQFRLVGGGVNGDFQRLGEFHA